jgi:tetratricopeptide (TPR) repeat protein
MRYLFLLVLFFTASYPDSLEQEDNIEKVLEAIYEKKENFSQDNFYEETLEKAYYAYLEKDYKRAIQKLDLIFSKYNEKDWRYFAIRAKTHEALEQEDEAINHYTFSIALNPAQPDIFKKLYELNFKIRRPVKSFDYTRLNIKR